LTNTYVIIFLILLGFRSERGGIYPQNIIWKRGTFAIQAHLRWSDFWEKNRGSKLVQNSHKFWGILICNLYVVEIADSVSVFYFNFPAKWNIVPQWDNRNEVRIFAEG
jgi:hypothetical protein